MSNIFAAIQRLESDLDFYRKLEKIKAEHYRVSIEIDEVKKYVKGLKTALEALIEQAEVWEKKAE